jgi:hypothetical protein
MEWCLRDHLDKFFKAGTMWKKANYSVCEGEALALLEAMIAMENAGGTQVIFERFTMCSRCNLQFS